MSYTKIAIRIPEDYALPAIFEGKNADAIALALTLGAEAYEIIQRQAHDTIRKETHADAVKEATRAYDKTLQALKQEKLRVDEALRAATIRLNALEQSADSQRATMHKEARESLSELIAAKDTQIGQLQGQLEKQLGAIGAKVDTLQNSITKTFSSSKEKGTFGEILMESFLKKAFDCDITVVSKEAQTADIRMMRGPELEYFWEVKNYTRMVTTEEVEKFRRDMRLHPSIKGGCLVSLRQGIVGKSRGGDIDIEFLEDGRFILFLSNLLQRDDIVFYLQTLRPLFQTVEALGKPIKEDSDLVYALKAKAALITNLLRTHSASVTKHKNSLVSHRKRMDAMFTEFQGLVMESETQLQSLLRVALGNDEEEEEVRQESEMMLASFVFKKERVADFDGRPKAFLLWLLSVATVREGTQVEIKELIEKAKEKGYGEKFVRDLREDMFQPSAWEKGARFIMGLTLTTAP